jgi:hypothetical protein
VLYLPFLVVVIVIWVMLMTKAWRGETYKLPYLGDLAEQLLVETTMPTTEARSSRRSRPSRIRISTRTSSRSGS